MKKTLILGSALIALASLSNAAPTISMGTPNEADYSPSNTLSPQFGTLINFDSLTPYTTLASNQFASVGVTSIASTNASDPLMVYPYSSQSAPFFVSTSDYMGGLTVTLAKATNIMGIGVEESDGNPVTIEALGATGNVLATFSETIGQTGNTADNAYFVVRDTTNDIQGLEVVATTGSTFGVDDVQFAPEPVSFVLAGSGLGLFGLLRLRRRKA